MLQRPHMNSMATSREEIFIALFDLLKNAQFKEPVNGQKTWSGFARKFVIPEQIAREAHPFLSQFEALPEIYERTGFQLPAVRTLGARVFGWARVDSEDPNELGTQYVTTMLEAIEKALDPEPGFDPYGFPNMQTLGGLVQWARIDGTILKYPGDSENQAMVCIPIRVLWP